MAQVLLAEERVPATGKTFTQVRAKFGEQDAEIVAVTAKEAVEASRLVMSSEGEGGWRSYQELTRQRR